MVFIQNESSVTIHKNNSRIFHCKWDQENKAGKITISLTISRLLSSSLSASFSYSRLFFRSLISQFLRRCNRRKCTSILMPIKNSSTTSKLVWTDVWNNCTINNLHNFNLKHQNRKTVLTAIYIFCSSSCTQRIKNILRKKRMMYFILEDLLSTLRNVFLFKEL